MAEFLLERPYYFLHTLVGVHSRNFGKIMMNAGRSEWPDLYKMNSFLQADPETPEGVNLALGLDLREVMCTVSKKSPAVKYHDNYGLVIEGAVKACFDNDSGCVLQEDGTYNDFVFDFTNPTSPEDLTGNWYDDYTKQTHFTWNEVVLEKGSKVVGVFFDPDKPPRYPDSRKESGRTKGEEYELFLEKTNRCGLAVLHIDSNF